MHRRSPPRLHFMWTKRRNRYFVIQFVIVSIDQKTTRVSGSSNTRSTRTMSQIQTFSVGKWIVLLLRVYQNSFFAPLYYWLWYGTVADQKYLYLQMCLYMQDGNRSGELSLMTRPQELPLTLICNWECNSHQLSQTNKVHNLKSQNVLSKSWTTCSFQGVD